MSPERGSLRVLLVNPGSLSSRDLDFGIPHLVSLGSTLEHRCRDLGLAVSLLDVGWEGGSLAALRRLASQLGPFRLAGVSCYSSYDVRQAGALGRALRAALPGVPLVVGGYHPSALPLELLAAAGGPFDHAVVGEGERPLEALLRGILDGPRPEPVLGPDPVEELDELAPYDWSLLQRYLPRAEELGRKVQIYLSRGCPHHCTFCMERCKAARRWRAFSVERALDELQRLSRVVQLGRWVVNLADPLFGLRPEWRRQLLEGIIAAGLLPRQFWTLTRVDQLQEEDVELLARARFSVGVGLESGSPRLLEIMRKTERPQAYLEGVRRFAGLARRHRLNWAANLIAGHPGETGESLVETAAFARELFLGEARTPGWLSVDPFRLYPGSQVFEQRADYETRFGTRFPYPRWWELPVDGAAAAELVDASAELSAEERTRLTTLHFAPISQAIADRFLFSGRSVDAVYERSLAEQVRLLSAASAEEQLVRLGRLRRSLQAPPVAGLVEGELLLPEPLLTALQRVSLGDFLPDGLAATAYLEGAEPGPDGPPSLAFYARALCGLDLARGSRLLVLGARSGLGAALGAELTGLSVEVITEKRWAAALRGHLPGRAQVRSGDPVRLAGRTRRRGEPQLDAILLEACVPRLPISLTRRLRPGGRLAAVVGPMYVPRAQRLRIGEWDGEQLRESDGGPASLPPLCGEGGWLRPPARLPWLRARAR